METSTTVSKEEDSENNNNKMVDKSPNHHNHSRKPVDWQITKQNLSERGQYLLETGIWSDCTFVVGLPPNLKVFRCHKMFLAMASPVFEAMFFGGLAESSNGSTQEIKILDVQPDAFYVMLQYIYTDNINLNSFELVCDICYAAKKYMLPALVEECTKYLWRDLYPRNACRAYEFAKLFEEPVLLDKSMQMIRNQSKDILTENTFEDVEHATLCVVLNQPMINADEASLFEGMVRWGIKECERRGMDSNQPDRQRQCLGEALFLIRYLTFPPSDFAAGPAKSGLLTQTESFAILMNISSPGSWEMPEYMNNETEPRQIPRELMPMLSSGPADVDVTIRFWCHRAMMQEPHCLNTSILDCSVTFTVDKDICIHGIEVPSQVTEVPENIELPMLQNLAVQANNQMNVAPAQAPNNNAGGAIQINNHQGSNEYNELLYAHLLDADGNRLTYTHFTAKVERNTMIEIEFNRSVYVKANKVYRIGMVLNKVGCYLFCFFHLIISNFFSPFFRLDGIQWVFVQEELIAKVVFLPFVLANLLILCAMA